MKAPGIVAKEKILEDAGGKPAHVPAFNTEPDRLRDQARSYSEVARNETDPKLKRAYASVAFALAQLCECLERIDLPPLPKEG